MARNTRLRFPHRSDAPETWAASQASDCPALYPTIDINAFRGGPTGTFIEDPGDLATRIAAEVAERAGSGMTDVYAYGAGYYEVGASTANGVPNPSPISLFDLFAGTYDLDELRDWWTPAAAAVSGNGDAIDRFHFDTEWNPVLDTLVLAGLVDSIEELQLFYDLAPELAQAGFDPIDHFENVFSARYYQAYRAFNQAGGNRCGGPIRDCVIDAGWMGSPNNILDWFGGPNPERITLARREQILAGNGVPLSTLVVSPRVCSPVWYFGALASPMVDGELPIDDRRWMALIHYINMFRMIASRGYDVRPWLTLPNDDGGGSGYTGAQTARQIQQLWLLIAHGMQGAIFWDSANSSQADEGRHMLRWAINEAREMGLDLPHARPVPGLPYIPLTATSIRCPGGFTLHKSDSLPSPPPVTP